MTAPGHAARLLGGHLEGSVIRCPGPGHSARDRSLSVKMLSDGGLFVWSFAGDDWRVCRQHVAGVLGIEDDQRRPAERKPEAVHHAERDHDADRIARALSIWHQGRPITGTIAERYLLRRGIDLGASPLATSGDVLRFHPHCPMQGERGPERHPALLALFRCIKADAPRAITRIALRPDGSAKASIPRQKQFLGVVGGAAIKVDADDEVLTGLHIAEGIETALAVWRGGGRPVWALGSAGAIERLPVLAGVECVTIAADNDPAGLRAARNCASRWQAAGREGFIRYPANTGNDFADHATKGARP